MSEESVALENKPEGVDKLTSLFNEEIYVRVDAGSIPTSKFKIYDDLVEFYKNNNKLADAKSRLQDHLKEHSDSISARYMLGMMSLMENKDSMDEDGFGYLRNLLEDFKNHAKWGILEYITDNILKLSEQRVVALRYKAEALEKLKKNKELKGVLEKLVKHDRKNPEIAKKYAMSIIDENKDKAIESLKQAAESFARTKDFDQLEEIWPILVANNHDDIQFIEKIERIMLGHRERERLVGLLYPLVDPFKDSEDWDGEIYILKKILDYEASSQKARNEIIRSYKAKYAEHSLLEDFLKMSELGNNKKPVKLCIANFERNIVFDTNNYVMHRNWGVGKITSISANGDSIFVDFQDKKEHKLSIQMAITSLKPLKKDHIWVQYYENKAEIEELFTGNIPEFLIRLLTSFDNKMTISEIKHELVEVFVKTADWSKWWNKAKNALKKEPRIGFNPQKKDEVIYRQKPITLAEELSEKFNAQTDFNKKLDIAMEALKDLNEAEEAIDLFCHFYKEEEDNADIFRKIIAYLYLEEVRGKVKGNDDFDEDFVPSHLGSDEIGEFLKKLEQRDLLNFSATLNNLEIKKKIIHLIEKYRPDNVEILTKVLYEVPVKINKHVFSELVSKKKHDELNVFFKELAGKCKDHPEVFLWVAKSILGGSWKYEWMNVSHKDLILQVFRMLKPLVKIEPKGSKLKNTVLELITGSDAILEMAVELGDDEYLRKLYALFKEVPFISDPQKQKLYERLNELKPDIKWSDEAAEEDNEEEFHLNIPEGKILVTRKTFNDKKDYFNHILNVVMPENSKDIGEAQEKGDLRENAEYKAAMEKQQQLQAEIKRLEEEIKSAQILDFSEVKVDRVNIGCVVGLENKDNGEKVSYAILGAWDADTEKNIISYQSPLAKALLGRRSGDEAILDFEGNHTAYNVLDVSRFSYAD